MNVMRPFAKANGYRVHAYEIRSSPFHFSDAHDLDLHNVDFTAFAAPGKALLNLSNAGLPVVDAVLETGVAFKGVRVLRDPRQILTSSYFHHREGHPTSALGWVWDKLEEDRPHLVRMSLEEGLLYELDNISGAILRHQVAAWRPRSDTIEFRLEEIAGAGGYHHPAFAKLRDFLGLGTYPTLKFQHTFENPDARAWWEVFTPKVIFAFKEQWGQLLIDLGYEQSLDWRIRNG